MASKRSVQYQEFFNKLKLTAKDLDSSRAIDILKDRDAIDSDVYRWMTSYMDISNERRDRYKDYTAMIQIPELELGLTTYADDGSQTNPDGFVIDISSNNDDIVSTLEETFFDNLDLNAELWKYFFGTCQYGDNFYEIILDDAKKEIISLKYLPPMNVERIEIDGNLLKFLVHKNIKDPHQPRTTYASERHSAKAVTLQPWEVVHFKIDDNVYAPYGRSVFESGRRTYKQLALMEDAMLVYRLERAPEKRVFYIDIGTMSTAEGEKWVDRIKAKFRKKRWIDPTTGKISEKATPLSILEDFWIPVRSGQQGAQGTRIDVLQGGRQLNEIDDTKYFRDKLMKCMHIPPQYMQEGGGMDTRNALSQMDIKFARTIERIQRHIVKGLEKIAIVALTAKRFRGDDLRNFKIEITPPSNIAELLEMEVLSQKMNLVNTMLTTEGFLSKKWIYEKIMKFSEKEISDLTTELQLQMASPLTQMQAGGVGAPGMAGAPGPGLGAAPPEAGGMAGAPEMGAPGEMPPVGPEAGGEVPPPPPPPAPGPEVAGQEVDINKKQYLLENKKAIGEFLKEIEQRRNKNKDNVKHNAAESRHVTNKYRSQFIKGEFKGLQESLNNKKKKLK